MTSVVSTLTIVGTNDEVVICHIGASPVEAASLSVCPSWRLELFLIGRIFIGNGQGNVVGLLVFTTPETGENMPIVVRQRHIRLPLKHIVVQPH